MKSTIAVAGLIFLSTAVSGQEAISDFAVEARLLSEAPVVDGHMNEKVWEEAALVTDFIQIEPDAGAPATEKTEIRIGYDDRTLYIGARCYQSEPEKIVAVAMDRDRPFGTEDSVHIVLDTFLDGKNAFYFATNPLGAQLDALVRNDGEDRNYAWDGVWASGASLDARGWTAEIAIPWRTLRFSRTEEQIWGINLRRNITYNREQLIWKPTSHFSTSEVLFKVSDAGRLTGLKNLKQGRQYDIRPHLIARWNRDELEGGDAEIDAGVDVKKNITSAVVLDLTYHLDFAEVEADLQQVNLTRFKLYFPEKREFFLEGANLFYLGERRDYLKQPDKLFFFSRRIGLTEDGRREIPVLGGAKISGRLAGTGIGFLHLTTEDLTYTDSQGQERYEPRTNYSVLRLKRNVLKKSTLGLMWLNKEVSGGDDNSGAAVDWDFGLGKHLKTGGFLAKTSSPDREGTDWAGMADLVWDGKQAFLKGVYTEIGEDFNPEMGFFSRLGIREWRGTYTYVFRPKKYNLSEIWAISDCYNISDREGNLQSRSGRIETDLVWKNQVMLALKLFDRTEVLVSDFEVSDGVVIPPGEYDFQSYLIGVQAVPGRVVWPAGRFLAGDYYDGTFKTLVLLVVINPMAGLDTRFDYEHTEVDLPAGEFETDLVSARATYSLSPRVSFRALIQWRKDDNFDGNLLFRWIYKPGASFYVAYDELRDLTDHPAALSSRRDRSLIVKMGFYY
ncbi:MAG: carbohydrate binding family 9 domain-containing protein [bacterium]|nr:carbohydrate binding family 9 domain-containing protein [bacterium]